jgi:ATP-dependent RNA helicase RhlE
MLTDPKHVAVEPEAGHTPRIEQRVLFVDKEAKTPLLLNLLEDPAIERALVFTRTKHRAKTLAQQLDRKGFGATALHGNLSQNKRQKALDDFKRGSFRVLVATDIAARGIDVADISHVVNYDMPDTTQAYTHRVGRTGRAEKTGAACSFVTRDDRDLVRSLERSLGERLHLQAVGAPEREQAGPAQVRQRPAAQAGPAGSWQELMQEEQERGGAKRGRQRTQPPEGAARRDRRHTEQGGAGRTWAARPNEPGRPGRTGRSHGRQAGQQEREPARRDDRYQYQSDRSLRPPRHILGQADKGQPPQRGHDHRRADGADRRPANARPGRTHAPTSGQGREKRKSSASRIVSRWAGLLAGSK